MERDHVDRIISQWRAERPDLDVSPMAVWGRVARLARIASRHLDDTFASVGLTQEGYDVLATLRRAGRPYRLTPTQLFRMLMLSSGTMTSRLDRLERAGHVRRLPDPDDRRGTLVELTQSGRTMVDQATLVHLANERKLLGGLSEDEQTQLSALLRTLLLSLDQPD